MKQKGLTLIEVMASIAIFLLIISTVYAFLSIGRVVWFSQDAVIGVQSEARKAIDFMAMELKSAVNIQPLKSVNDDNRRDDEIVFQIPVYCTGNGFLVIVGDNRYYVESVIGAGGLNAGAYLFTDFDIDPDTLRMRIESADSSRRGRRIIYSLGGLNNSQLIRTVLSPGGIQLEATVLANNITGVRFRRRDTFTESAPERRIIIIEVDTEKHIFTGWEGSENPANDLRLSTRVSLMN
jgi:prepilin-type N-terminal cleavage/methylation domain-containing protein